MQGSQSALFNIAEERRLNHLNYQIHSLPPAKIPAIPKAMHVPKFECFCQLNNADQFVIVNNLGFNNE